MRAAISTLYRASSLATRAVHRSGQPALGLSISVRTFHDPIISCFTFLCVVRQQIWDTLQPEFAGQGRVKQTIVGVLFLAPSFWIEVRRAILKRAAWTLRGLPNPTTASIQ